MQIFITVSRIRATGVILFLLFYAVVLSAQDFKLTITNLREGYGKMEKLHAVMVIRAFQDTLSTKPYYNEKADIKRDGKNYLYRIPNMDMLMNARYMIVADKESKHMVCSKRDINAEDDFFGKDPIKVNIDSMLAILGSKPQFKGRKGDVETYRIFRTDGIITRIDVKINTRENVMSSLTYLYKDGQCAKIDFEVFDKQPVFNADTFDERAYMIVLNGKFRTSVGYKDFTIQEVKN